MTNDPTPPIEPRPPVAPPRLPPPPSAGQATGRSMPPPPVTMGMPSGAPSPQRPREPYRGQAITSLVLGLVGIFVGLTTIPAIIFGIVALRGCKRMRAPRPGIAVAGITLGVIGITLWAILIAFIVSIDAPSDRDGTRRDDGEITEAGDIGVFRLQEGDCLLLDGGALGASELMDVPGVPCREPHTGEVVSVDDDYFTESLFPGEEALFVGADDFCIDRLDAYTNTSSETSAFDVFVLVPTERSWGQDDRSVTCIGVTLDEDFLDIVETTGSIRGS